MKDFEQAALLLRTKVRDAELAGIIKESESLAYLDSLHKIESALIKANEEK